MWFLGPSKSPPRRSLGWAPLTTIPCSSPQAEIVGGCSQMCRHLIAYVCSSVDKSSGIIVVNRQGLYTQNPRLGSMISRCYNN
jgi:hypothetical protein